MKQTIDIDNWIIEATSAYNDGYTRQHYIEKLRELKDQLNSLDFLNEYNHGEKSDKQQANSQR
ncbi:MAG TPA: hypothetical protein DEO59_04195 [Balneola sp.]|jgi:hypothetical protein|nr:hypothetical protein [Balneola sp.]|tara:strand:- start:771 stop:959 length:189 start_codon:yes stop_codon:yes gene_type:complete